MRIDEHSVTHCPYCGSKVTSRRVPDRMSVERLVVSCPECGELNG